MTRTAKCYSHTTERKQAREQTRNAFISAIKKLMHKYDGSEIPNEDEFADKLAAATQQQCTAEYQGGEIDDGCDDGSCNSYVMKNWLSIHIGNEEFTVKMYYGDCDNILGYWVVQ